MGSRSSLSGDEPLLGFDQDDIFGLRRALASLPESDRDDFIVRWTEIGERCAYKVDAVRIEVVSEAERWIDVDELLQRAWTTVSDSMSVYVERRTGAA